jgi:hypothetical protein
MKSQHVLYELGTEILTVVETNIGLYMFEATQEDNDGINELHRPECLLTSSFST